MHWRRLTPQPTPPRRAKAGDAFSAGEATRSNTDRAAKQADQKASEARELRAGLSARLEGARERLQEMASAIRETARMEPDALAATLAEQQDALPKDAQGVEQRLYSLERERELIGARSFTAIFAGNDHMALGLIRALYDAGVRVPEDVSVIGFDDVPEAAYYLPPLTTVRQDFAEVGRRTIAVLLAAIEGQAPLEAPFPAPELIVRGSTGPAPAR